jgi:thiol:disulfide interchange protein DsbA
MLKKIILLVIFSLVLLGCGTDSKFSEGTNYYELKFAKQSKTPQVVLFFSAACPHCYQFDKVFETWVAQKPDEVVVERIPVRFAKDEWKSLQKVYATLRALNVQDEMTIKMFEAIQDKRFWLGDERAVVTWLTSHGFDAEKVKYAYSSDYSKQLLAAYSASESRYRVRSIPRAIVNGIYEIKIKALVGETDEDKGKYLFELIEHLLKK